MSKILNWFKKGQDTKQNTPSQADAGTIVDADIASTNDQEIKSEQTADSTSEKLSEQAPEQVSELQAVDVQQDQAAPTPELKVTPVVSNPDVVPNDTSSGICEAQATAEPEAIPEPLAKQEPAAKQESEATAEDETSTQTKPSLFSRLKSSLSRTKANIGSGFTSLLLGKNIDDDLYEELETQLLLADVGMNTTNKIITELTQQAKSSQLKDGEALSAMLQSQMQVILDKVDEPIDFSIAKDSAGQKQPFVILMVGVNGVGKTTTIGKLAKQYQAQGKSVMLAAGDTFRAAAVEQLQVWGERNDIAVVAQHTGADSASVIFDAIASAQAKNVDVLIADTAGRLQNKDHLIEELKKVVRVMKKLIPNAPHEIMLTLDASTGQNAISQTRIFNQAVGITGINLTKLDGSAKGGVIFALADEFNIPVRYIGIGEGIDDLREFESKAFVDALFAD
jgi:fused signal recognition particle receptor